MSHITKPLLALLALLLVLWLIWGFWPLGTGSRIFLSVGCLLLAALWSWRFWHQPGNAQNNEAEDALPPEQFEGAVVLVCGDSGILFTDGEAFRETRQGWYICVRHPEKLVHLAELIVSARPALMAQVSVMLAVAPEQWQSEEAFDSQLHQWQRAVALCRRAFSRLPPLWCSVWLNSPQAQAESDYRWFFVASNKEGFQVQESTGVAESYLSWCQGAAAEERSERLCNSLWLQSLFNWLKPQVVEVLAQRHHDTPALSPRFVAICVGPVSTVVDNIWQHHLAASTTLSARTGSHTGTPPMPDMLLPHLPQKHGISRSMRCWRIAGAFVGMFLLAAMLASYINNMRLAQNVKDHLALYQHLDGSPPEPKVLAQKQLHRDAALLDQWQREGAPVRYTLGLYQGGRLAGPLLASINDWAPPAPPAPVINKIVQGPKTIRLDSMSLFDSGKALLKPGSTKLLVNSLVGIKAKPGWLIVVSGHTDNTGNAKLNQTLSLKRAEAVRDWMRDTGDVPESCFAVQGYGAGRPAATNDTPEGRALNRRVEISLVPQADACRLPGETLALSQDDGVLKNEME